MARLLDRMRQLSLGTLTALATVMSLGLVFAFEGPRMFSPGPLSETRRGAGKNLLGGVLSHAALERDCAACHAPPWRGESMADRCLACHTDVQKDIAAARGMHGKMPSPRECRLCHGEHHGPAAGLTSFAHFDHDWCAFPLTGKHKSTGCGACHVADRPGDSLYRGTPQRCEKCHAEPAVHKGRFGLDCAGCHTTSTWSGTAFRHSFPITHGGGKQNRTCATCHTNPADYKVYTCTDCHVHRPEQMAKRHARLGMADISACATCHPTGREHKR